MAFKFSQTVITNELMPDDPNFGLGIALDNDTSTDEEVKEDANENPGKCSESKVDIKFHLPDCSARISIDGKRDPGPSTSSAESSVAPETENVQQNEETSDELHRRRWKEAEEVTKITEYNYSEKVNEVKFAHSDTATDVFIELTKEMFEGVVSKQHEKTITFAYILKNY
ncbi:hypothetical protein PR048_015486 [Dryococelus australis]|uniref:Uncharacterized protein n=1 Tax=Dryococelus australis TaxID=614101 RepID=A0ABQ9HH25_9NEOP|nr:hypothetical protein PR048_015486 [Dryococelus australis]